MGPVRVLWCLAFSRHYLCVFDTGLVSGPISVFQSCRSFAFFGAGPGRNLHLEVERIDLVVCAGATKK